MENSTTKRVREANNFFNLSKTSEIESFINENPPVIKSEEPKNIPSEKKIEQPITYPKD